MITMIAIMRMTTTNIIIQEIDLHRSPITPVNGRSIGQRYANAIRLEPGNTQYSFQNTIILVHVDNWPPKEGERRRRQWPMIGRIFRSK